MSSWLAEFKRQEQAQRREERAAKKRQRELERRSKERAKLSELEQARLAVDQFENVIDVLLSVHKDQNEPVDWLGFVSALPPHAPQYSGKHEFVALLNQSAVWSATSAEQTAKILAEARSLDRHEYESAIADHRTKYAEWRRMRSLAQRVLNGRIDAYHEAIREFFAIGEMSSLGSAVELQFHGPQLVECTLQVRGRGVIPMEVKSLTASGKLTVKTMPKVRFHEIYQDYVCGCVLRLAREILALLPLETVFVTAVTEDMDSRSDCAVGLPVLSVALSRAEVLKLDFVHLDPSDAIEKLPHRGDAKISRRSGTFLPIIPLSAADSRPTTKSAEFDELLSSIRNLRHEFQRAVSRPDPLPSAAGAPEL